MSEVQGATRRVFIAEDNPILLQGLERALSANGYEVETAEDGPAALGLLRGIDPPDVLILDVMMPGMSGLEVLEAVRADERTAAVPVMLITAAAEELAPLGAVLGDRVDVLMKPFRLNELLGRISALVGGRRPAERSPESLPAEQAAARR